MNACSICRHKHVTEMDAMVVSKRPAERVAIQFEVSAQALRRHIRNGHVQTGGVAASVPMPKTGDGPLDAMADLQAQLTALDRIAATSPSLQLQVLEARRRVVSDIAKIAPPTADLEGPAARKAAILEEMIRVLEDVIEAHPEIRKEAAVALHAWRATRPGSTEPAPLSATLAPIPGSGIGPGRMDRA